MSLPRELLDDLLSGYMDGELSADENARVEQMLATDPAVRRQLRTLQEQAEGVREAIGSARHLDAAFADRVLAATFAEAERSGLAVDHPVRLAAAAPRRRFSRLRWGAIGGLAIAASLTAAVVLLRDGGVPGGGGQPPRVATTAPPVDDVAATGAQPQPAVPDGEADAPQPAESPADRPVVEIASAEARTAIAGEAERPGQPAEELAGATADDARVAAADVAPMPDAPVSLPLADGQTALRAVLVYQVQVTPLGRERGVINRALREAEIRIANHREVDDALVGYLESSDLIGDETGQPAGDAPQVSVLFLEGPGKQLEKLMLSLLSADEEVRSVGFALAMDPPVMAAIDTLEQVDPTAIRGEPGGAVARSLIPTDGQEGAEAELSPAFPAGDRDFMPLRRDSLAGLSSASGLGGDDPTDITARTLMVIRFE